MITAGMIIDAKNTIRKDWGEDGDRVIKAAAEVLPFNGTTKDFLNHCIACGGNWGGMLLSGIKELYFPVWEAIPDDMGSFAFADICATLLLCGVDTSE